MASETSSARGPIRGDLDHVRIAQDAGKRMHMRRARARARGGRHKASNRTESDPRTRVLPAIEPMFKAMPKAP